MLPCVWGPEASELTALQANTMESRETEMLPVGQL